MIETRVSGKRIALVQGQYIVFLNLNEKNMLGVRAAYGTAYYLPHNWELVT